MKLCKTRLSKLFLVVTAIALTLCCALCVCGCSGTQSSAKQVSVTMSVDATAADRGMFVDNKTFQVKEGATVLDVLAEAKLPYTEKDGYVSSLNGLSAGDVTAMSGWMFYVNGESPIEACNKIKVAEGDVVLWQYITEFNF